MASFRKHIYFSDDRVIKEIKQRSENKNNVSKYVENCILFYMENNDVIRKYINSMSNMSDAIAKNKG